MNYSIPRHLEVLRQAREEYSARRHLVKTVYQGELAGTWAFGMNSKRKGWSLSRAVEEWKRQEGI